ncbi:hypothetical protein CLOM621_08933 [Clostridium sp. M62/1]|nr:hypothetical protein CLOM621_08933 [Clostridium sp. M62/1]
MFHNFKYNTSSIGSIHHFLIFTAQFSGKSWKILLFFFSSKKDNSSLTFPAI